jgi:hypothetical protein
MRRNIYNSDAECYHPSVITNRDCSSSHGTCCDGKQSASTQTDKTASTQTEKKPRSICGRRRRADSEQLP